MAYSKKETYLLALYASLNDESHSLAPTLLPSFISFPEIFYPSRLDSKYCKDVHVHISDRKLPLELFVAKVISVRLSKVVLYTIDCKKVIKNSSAEINH